MNKNGMGYGSASVVLVFATLCLTIFALISLTSANAEKKTADRMEGIVTGYYEADTLAERILAEILAAEEIPDEAGGVEITTSQAGGAKYAIFYCPVSGTMELYVEVAIYEGHYDILHWEMQDTGVWEIDGGINLWDGEF